MQIYFWDCESFVHDQRTFFCGITLVPITDQIRFCRPLVFATFILLSFAPLCRFTICCSLTRPIRSCISQFADCLLSLRFATLDSVEKKGKPCCNQQYLRIQYYLGHLLMPSDIICQLYADITLRNAHRLSITSSLSESYFPCTTDAGLSATSDPSSPTYTTIWHYSDSLMQRQPSVVLSPCASQSSLYWHYINVIIPSIPAFESAVWYQ